MSRYIPPHKRLEIEAKGSGSAKPVAANVPEDEPFQREAWTALSRTLIGIINKVTENNLESIITELFRENLVRGRGLLVGNLIRTQNADAELTKVLAALVGRLNKEFPELGLLLARRLANLWKRLHLRREWWRLEHVNKFLAWLYMFNVVEVDLVYQMVMAHLDSPMRVDDDISLAATVFRETFRMMSLRAPREFHEQVLTPFRDLLAMDDPDMRLSERAQASLESCLKEVQQWERVKHEVDVIPPHLLLVDLDEQVCHSVDLMEKYDGEEHLDRFHYDPKYAETEEAYEKIRCALLGDDWETVLLEQVAAAEMAAQEEEEDDDGGDAKGITQSTGGADAGAAVNTTSTLLDRDRLIDESERQVRKDVYIALRSSVRADEAVHKLLKGLKPNTNRIVCFMVIEGCCEEKSYNKMYVMVAERLCKSNARFQTFFTEAFRERYEHVDTLEERQIEYTCKIFGHLLRTDSLLWSHCFSVLDIIRNNVGQRLMIQYLLQELVEGMGMKAVQERLAADGELKTSARRLFPSLERVSAAELETAVNVLEAMKVGELATGMRRELDAHRRIVKRPREGD